jgi:hypothetical protein
VIYVLAAALAVLVGVVVLLAVRRPPKGDDVDRFNRARQMTTEWSRRYAATGHLDLPAPPAPERNPEPAEHR